MSLTPAICIYCKSLQIKIQSDRTRCDMAQNNEMIRFQNISKVYGGVTALQNISFGIRSGEIHAVVGENGAGKSTYYEIAGWYRISQQWGYLY